MGHKKRGGKKLLQAGMNKSRHSQGQPKRAKLLIGFGFGYRVFVTECVVEGGNGGGRGAELGRKQ